jgi:hypothetical protein
MNIVPSDTKVTYPVQFTVVGQDDVRRAQCEVRTQTWSFDGVQGVEESDSVFSGVESGGE